MRVQVSMEIQDEEIMEYLVKPMKAEHKFNLFLADLLQKYYYCAEMRAFVHGEADVGVEEDSAWEEVYSDIQETVATMDILAEDASNILGDGVSTFQDIVDQYTDAGIIHEQTTENGATVQKLKIEATKRHDEPIQVEHSNNEMGEVLVQLRKLTDVVSNIAERVGKLEEAGIRPQVTGGVSEENQEVFSPPPGVAPTNDEVDEIDEFEFDEPAQATSVAPSMGVDEPDGNARNSLLELLESIG